MFRAALEANAAHVQAHLDQQLALLETSEVAKAMAYSLQGGKRLRAFLVMQSATLFDIGPSQAIWPACAIEAVHAYSLVHDDLPCMDDDDLRRGKPTVHKAWDQATAVLAGDALHAFGFELSLNPQASPDPAIRADLALSLAQAGGARGMVLGQALDIAAETAAQPLTLEEIITLQQGKTGALIAWSAEAGARLAAADIAPLTAYACAIGLAFQIADDILDIEGDPEKAGKRLQKDEAAGKATFVTLLGLDGAKRRAKALVADACDALAPFGSEANSLQRCAEFIIARDN
ncbi:polyprenyl synthetase family protein [Rhodobacteraceae bacterium]|nr:polyprenyl synthetase family protein [Paracoccaceae bacterium]MDA9854968.1 polyprenyl synthetase family protein [Paracoccaceae bacterium]